MTASLEAGARFSSKQVVLFMALASVLAVVGMGALVYSTLFVSKFEPVVLSNTEEQRLADKLARLDTAAPRTEALPGDAGSTGTDEHSEALEPEPYSEVGASREIVLSERELNALLAKNTDLADKLVVDLSSDLASAKLLVPLDPEFPVLGGKTLRVTAGLELKYADGRPVVVLRGVSLWGVPLPNAWIGGIKNVDMVREFGAQEGFWKSFADGVELVRVEEGNLKITLKE